MTRHDAQRVMAAAISDKLREWRDERGEYLTSGSVVALREFAAGERRSIRLVVQIQQDHSESQRGVTISLVPRAQFNQYAFRVKVECSAWSTNPTQTAEALKAWGLAYGLALVALRTADKLPPIVEPVEEFMTA